ncbi:MAG: hypothetical protein E7351_03330 [Clostridiales bacterium]|nr:hypothetical protein [Clostridiales bacterium]
MSMIDEIEKFMSSVDTSINYRTINLGGRGLYIEGIKSVVSFGESEMIFELRKKTLVVEGNSIRVKYLDKTTCVLEGEITAVMTR